MDNEYCRPEWIEEQSIFTCSECGVEITKAAPCCPLCGSHMAGYDDVTVKASRIPDGIPENIKLRLMSINASIMSKSTEVIRGKVAGTFFCKNCGESVTKITANCPHCRYRFENYRYISDFITENKKIGFSGLTSVLLGYMSDHKEPSDKNNVDFNVTRVLIPGVNVHKKNIIKKYAGKVGTTFTSIIRGIIEREADAIESGNEHVVTLEILEEIQPGTFRCRIKGTDNLLIYTPPK